MILIYQLFSGNKPIETVSINPDKNNFKFISKSGIEYFIWNGIKSTSLLVIFSTRNSGVSTGLYNSLNLGFVVGDDDISVIKNRLLFYSAIGVMPEEIVTIKQMHGTDIINTEMLLQGPEKINPDGSANLGKGDAIYFNKSGIFAMMFYADCLPLILANTEKKKAMLLHVGRSGTYNEITVKAFTFFLRETKSEPGEIVAILGPRIKKCCYFLNQNIFKAFHVKFGYIKDIFDMKNNNISLDIGKINKMLLFSMGVDRKNLYDLELCTSCNDDLFFSFRRTGGNAGRQCALVGFI